MSRHTSLQTLLQLIEDYDDFNSHPIEQEPCPTAVEFAKHVSIGYPRLYSAYNTGAKNQSLEDGLYQGLAMPPCLALEWTKQDLVSKITNPIDIAVTPTGRADALHDVEINGQKERVFLQPANVQMSMSELLSKLSCNSTSDEKPRAVERSSPTSVQKDSFSEPVCYLQSQNSNLTSEATLAPLLSSIPANFPFAAPVLGKPEATNIWIGDERSITLAHRDPYENLYLVVKGRKIFTLWPPVQEILMDAQMVRTGKYVFQRRKDNDEADRTVTIDSGDFKVVIDEATDEAVEEGADTAAEPEPPRIPWVSVDADLPPAELMRQHPLYAEHASPRTVTVEEGQMLYLPSGWYHQVQQECGVWPNHGPGQQEAAPCIAINYWYDMEYEGEKYVMRQLLSRLVHESQSEQRAVDDERANGVEHHGIGEGK